MLLLVNLVENLLLTSTVAIAISLILLFVALFAISLGIAWYTLKRRRKRPSNVIIMNCGISGEAEGGNLGIRFDRDLVSLVKPITMKEGQLE